MNDKYQAVIDKLDAETEKKNRPEIRAIEAMLRSVCQNNEAVCECVLAEGKTMDGALSAMRDVASKRKGKCNCVCIAPDEAERIIFEYYGISGEKTASEPTETAESQTVGDSDTVSLFDLI